MTACEYTVVLQGGFTDVTGNYGPGDLQVMEDGMSHNPVADPGEDCINLAVTTGPLKFESLLQKIAAPAVRLLKRFFAFSGRRAWNKSASAIPA